MNSSEIKFSIIIPCFNEEQYISNALESIIYQNHNFKYEIVIINDCSTDGTEKVIRQYISRYPDIIKYFKNEKNFGNAYSFWKGLENSKGKYFHVLDGDDFFTNYDKINKQINFLDKYDDFVAVAHNSIRYNSNNQSITIERKIKKINDNIDTEYTYHQYLERKTYAHTSTYMYRNIFLNKKIPEKLKIFRGDDPRTLIFLKYSNKKVKFMNFIGSVYNFTQKGIWSSATLEERSKASLLFYKKYQELIAEDSIEKEFCTTNIKKIEYNTYRHQINKKNPSINSQNIMSSENFVRRLRYLSNQIIGYTNPKNRKQIFKNTHSVSFIDELCESLGRCYMTKKNYNIYRNNYDESKIVIVVGGFATDKGGAVIVEVRNLVKLYHNLGKSVYIFSTEIVKTDHNIIQKHFPVGSNRFSFIKIESKTLIDSIHNLLDEIYNIKAVKLYPFISHNDIVGNCAIQKGIAKEIIIDFVFDHGTSLGITNSSIDKIIVKSNYQYKTLLSKIPKNKLTYIPPFIKDEAGGNLYNAKKNKCITTACAAARSYKIETDSENKYFEVIPQIMKNTGGKHYHYGPLSDQYKIKILNNLKKLKIKTSNFIHIKWCNNVAKDLVRNGVDLYMQSFPIGGTFLPMQIMQYGIPIIGYENMKDSQLSGSSFISNNTLFWSNSKELLQNIGNLNTENLQNLSNISRSFYEDRYEYKKMSSRFIDNRGLEICDEELKHLPEVELIDILETEDILYENFHDKNILKSKKDKKGLFKIIDKLFPKYGYLRSLNRKIKRNKKYKK